MQSVYSWMGSPLHLVLEDDFAAAYNRAQDDFFEAQNYYRITTGSEWTGSELLELNWTPEEQTAWNDLGELINLLCKLNGGELDITQEQMTSDYLVKL